MPNIREILRMHEAGLSQRKIARSVGSSRDTVSKVLKRAERKGIHYQDVSSISDDKLEEMLEFKTTNKNNIDQIYEMPDYDRLTKELKRPGVTMQILWEEYCHECRQQNKVPYQRTQFYHHFSKYLKDTGFTDILHYKPGSRIEVDWAGTRPCWTDPDTGEIVKGYLFVGTLTYSQYSYAEVTADMKQETWINCHIHMFEYFHGVARILVPDNLKTGVIKHPKYDDPVLNRSYLDMADYYGMVIVPARVASPRDKNRTENMVNQFTKYIVGKLRNYQFFTVDEYNRQALIEVNRFNEKPFQKKPGSRASMYKETELECMNPLPKYPYEYAWWKKAKVQTNSHIIFEKRYYSVPHEYIGHEVDIKCTSKQIAIYYQRTLLCTHSRSCGPIGSYSTIPEHMPKNSNAYQQWDKERFIKWAKDTGENTLGVITALFARCKYEQQGYNGARSILMLANKYSKERLEAACGIALKNISDPRYRNIKAILANNQDSKETARKTPSVKETAFLRGADYYKGDKDHD